MRPKTSLILLLIVSCAVWAQTPAAPAKKAPPAKTAASAPQKPAPAAKAAPAVKPATEAAKLAAKSAPATQPAANAVPAKAATAKPAMSAKKAAKKPTVKVETKPKTAKPAAAAEKTASAKPAPSRGGRDPFVSPVVTAVNIAPCSGVGKRCLAINEIVLKGIAKTDNGMLAVVENAAKKAYFLRENDPVFNGVVVKITMDSVVLRENITDRLGHISTREVIKKIPTTPVA